jgi:hypothetical protein
MLAFITTIRHPDNAFSFERIEALLSQSLRSVCRQTDESFCVVIVTNCDLALSFAHPSLHFVTVDFPPPGVGRGRHLDYHALTLDKGTKTVVGIIRAAELGADHVMFVDSDDYMHRDLAKYANSHGGHPGWFSSAGYIYTSGLRYVHPIETDFHNKNGSTSILRTDIIAAPDQLKVSSTQTEITDAMGSAYVSSIIGQHGKWVDLLLPRGYVMESLPFPAAIWNVGTGENHTGNLVSGRRRRPIDKALGEEFGLPLPSLSTAFRTSVAVVARRAQRRLDAAKWKH